MWKWLIQTKITTQRQRQRQSKIVLTQRRPPLTPSLQCYSWEVCHFGLIRQGWQIYHIFVWWSCHLVCELPNFYLITSLPRIQWLQGPWPSWQLGSDHWAQTTGPTDYCVRDFLTIHFAIGTSPQLTNLGIKPTLPLSSSLIQQAYWWYF